MHIRGCPRSPAGSASRVHPPCAFPAPLARVRGRRQAPDWLIRVIVAVACIAPPRGPAAFADPAPRGETEMRDYQLLEPGSIDKPGKVKHTRTYKLTPGIAHVYNEGDLHSPKREGPTSLIRIEGTNMAKVKRFKFEQV